MIVIVFLALFVIAAIFISLWSLDRSERRKEQEWQIQHHLEMKRAIKWMSDCRKKEEAARARIVQAVSAKSWSELRFLCECLRGQPCECATKHQIAMNLLKARQQIEKESVG